MENTFQRAIDAHSEKTGKKVHRIKKELSELLYGMDNYKSRNANINNLYKGKNKTISLEHISIITEYLGITPNELFGFKEKSEAKIIVDQIKEIVNK